MTGDDTLVILPSTEYLNTFLLTHRTTIERMNCEIPLVDAALYKELTSKHTGTAFFKAAGLSVPRELDPDRKLDVPVVAKPRINVSASGHSLYPQLLETTKQLSAFRKTHDTNDFFFQEFVRGDSLYLLFYLSPQNHDFVWSQRNLLQQPGGKSMLLAEAADFHHSHTASLILAALHERRFHGLGMVEVLRAADRDVFIEMNPRIWGPVQFCMDQHQPLLQAFIGAALHDDVTHCIDRRPRLRRKRYFWLGGILETRHAQKQPAWHMPRKGLGATILGNLACDVFLRGDSWRCFMHDLRKTTIKASPSHE